MRKRLTTISIYLGAILIWAALSLYSAHAASTTTSGITATTIASRAQVYLDAANDPFYTNAKFVQWIDEAVKETVNKTGCLETTSVSVTLEANVDKYSITGAVNFLKVIAVEHDNGDTTDPKQIITLDRTNKNDIGHNDKTGRPQIYAIWNNQIQVWPIPRTSEAGTSLYIYRVPLPTGVSAIDSAIETPAYLDTAILYYVVAMGSFADQKQGLGNLFMTLYENRIAEYNALMIQRKPIE